MKTSVCIECGKTFDSSRKAGKRSYCSRECYQTHRNKEERNVSRRRRTTATSKRIHEMAEKLRKRARERMRMKKEEAMHPGIYDRRNVSRVSFDFAMANEVSRFTRA